MAELKYRLAARIHDRMPEHKEDEPALNYLEGMARCARRVNSRVQILVKAKSLKHLSHFRDDIGYNANMMDQYWRAAKDRMTNSQRPRGVKMSVDSIAKDIEALNNEFGGWEFKDKQKLIVTTDEITIEDVNLGKFRIELNIESLEFQIVAVTPKLSCDSDACTHPHVYNNTLCTGDHEDTLNVLLDTGQIFDFFLRVNTILHSYDGDEAHERIETWEEATSRCNECGDNADGYSCNDCSDDLCSECGRGCASCGDALCSNCGRSCNSCNHVYCNGCDDDVRSCEQCSGHVCESCEEGCTGCDHIICKNCMKICSECEEDFCGDCLIVVRRILSSQRVAVSTICKGCSESEEE